MGDPPPLSTLSWRATTILPSSSPSFWRSPSSVPKRKRGCCSTTTTTKGQPGFLLRDQERDRVREQALPSRDERRRQGRLRVHHGRRCEDRRREHPSRPFRERSRQEALRTGVAPPTTTTPSRPLKKT